MLRYASVLWVFCLFVFVVLVTACGPGGPTAVEPLAPANVTVTSGQGFITVTWEHDGANATGFVVYREAVAASGEAAARPSSLSQLVQVGLDVRSYRDDDVAAGTPYRYGVATKGSGSQVSSVTLQTGTPIEPEPAPGTIADYVVGSGRVATVTSISGVIADYDSGAVDATFAGLGGSVSIGCPVGDPDCQPSFTPGRPWVPTSIAADGGFTITLPTSPALDDIAQLLVCDQTVSVSSNGLLYVHDEPLGQPGSSPSAAFARWRIEDPKTRVETPVGFLADALILVLYGYSPVSVDVACVQDESLEDQVTRMDVDMRLRPGWNVITWLHRSESGTMVLYMRTGEPDLPVPWVEPEPLGETHPNRQQAHTDTHVGLPGQVPV